MSRLNVKLTKNVNVDRTNVVFYNGITYNALERPDGQIRVFKGKWFVDVPKDWCAGIEESSYKPRPRTPSFIEQTTSVKWQGYTFKPYMEKGKNSQARRICPNPECRCHKEAAILKADGAEDWKLSPYKKAFIFQAVEDPNVFMARCLVCKKEVYRRREEGKCKPLYSGKEKCRGKDCENPLPPGRKMWCHDCKPPAKKKTAASVPPQQSPLNF
jgi:hypothetical protein